MQKLRKPLALLSTILAFSMLASACSNSKGNEVQSSATPATSGESSAPASAPASGADPVTLKFWTWHPSADLYKAVIEKFEASHPGIKVELTVMETKDFQMKMPLALSTGENLDVVGVQTGAMPKQIQADLLPLEDLISQIRPDWQSVISENSVSQAKVQSDGLKFLPMASIGSMIMYYNKDILDELNLPAPKTYEQLKAISDKLRDTKSNKLSVAVGGKDAWILDEVAWTIAGQQSDLYNQWRYNGKKLDGPEYIQAVAGFQKLFTDGIINRDDVMDLDYTSSRNAFTSGQAAFLIQGTWEANLLLDSYRVGNQVSIKDVGVLPIPSIEPNGKSSIRSFIDLGLGIPANSKHPKEAMQLIDYLIFGEGNDMLASTFAFSTNKTGFVPDSSLLTTPTAQESYKTLSDLLNHPSADRNNNSPFSDVVGQQLQKMLINKQTPEVTAKAIQKEFETGKYPNE
ncbi:ABC transporter substrate-binding protein [Cohnella abietis]|uniref:Putative ABC transporter extracellular-binding protein YurO n=1 Tax=Cohnella abietis TaxID=2507935 RepID=A0A3T1DCL1_9BACL|nr:extracellular solute-binding protein [Cohnella abietis]BBI35860.1 putative ABC transporter extracellular-binding protein YurO [Cohnella abietis]